ncbi:putative X protein [Sekira virus]|uniref:X protein n=1 Tax=Sekira virus TaxID=2776145 RepID=A0AAD1NGI0_9MONO|nr:putative X protein [Sekira virus]BCL64175.1 putative X protein [Sekira virus]
MPKLSRKRAQHKPASRALASPGPRQTPNRTIMLAVRRIMVARFFSWMRNIKGMILSSSSSKQLEGRQALALIGVKRLHLGMDQFYDPWKLLILEAELYLSHPSVLVLPSSERPVTVEV